MQVGFVCNRKRSEEYLFLRKAGRRKEVRDEKGWEKGSEEGKKEKKVVAVTHLGTNFPLSFNWKGLARKLVASIILSAWNLIILEACALRLRGSPTPVGMMYDESNSIVDFCQFESYYLLWSPVFTHKAEHKKKRKIHSKIWERIVLDGNEGEEKK